jgi:hypothetical protein
MDWHPLLVRQLPETVIGDLFFRQERESEPEIDGFEIVGVLPDEVVEYTCSTTGVPVVKVIIIHHAQEMKIIVKPL